MPAMQKILSGRDLADYIQERQGRQARALIQTGGIQPKLAIIVTTKNPTIELYVKLKQRYGNDISVDVEVHRVSVSEAAELIDSLNNDDTVQGIIVQLPLSDESMTDEIVNKVAPAKDVDALGKDAMYEPATPMAIMWLLAGYNINLVGKHILLIGRGKLVGAPLQKQMIASGLDVEVADRSTDLAQRALKADIIITATGNPGILTADMIKSGAVVVDAGVASESGKTVGDLADDVYGRDDLTMTPKKGGVGPLTVCALFENVIRAAREKI